MSLEAWLGLLHPAIAIVVVFPLIGVVVNFAWETRQRRLQLAAGSKSKISPVVGREHVRLGRWLTGAVVGVVLLALAYVLLFKSFIEKQLLTQTPFEGLFIIVLFGLTIASLVLLYRAQAPRWRATFATLSSMGLIILGCQDGIFRRTNEWFWSHYYFGMVAAVLMIISLAIVPEIYQDRPSKGWRKLHIILNLLALFLFFGQGLTGVRDIFEIGLYTPPPT